MVFGNRSFNNLSALDASTLRRRVTLSEHLHFKNGYDHKNVRVNRNGDAARIVWNPPPRVGSYDVARGSLGLFPVGAPSGETCLVSGPLRVWKKF